MFRTDLLGFGLKLNKSLFFDRTAVANAVHRANKKALPRAGSFVRNAARRSMRSRKKASQPGMPPSAHRQDATHPHGPLLKDRLFFQFDPAHASVVIGPQKLPGSRTLAPATMEFGGFAKVRVIPPRARRSGTPATPRQKAAYLRKVNDGTIVRTKVTRVTKIVPVAARPYMAPAMKSELPKFPSLYANLVTA